MAQVNYDKAKIEGLARKMWFVLVAIFALLILWRLYEWTNGRANIYGILPPLGMILLGASTIVGPTNNPFITSCSLSP
ncbi:MAG: hypothetical protein ABR535_00990 [Pyrinomonadaceae bacterium]